MHAPAGVPTAFKSKDVVLHDVNAKGDAKFNGGIDEAGNNKDEGADRVKPRLENTFVTTPTKQVRLQKTHLERYSFI
jgi:hypothetical protein